MVMKRSALGRGLDALITMDDLKTSGSSSISEIELSKIQPNPEQPRSVFEQESLEELAASIRSLGVIQPITLKETGAEQYVRRTSLPGFFNGWTYFHSGVYPYGS